MACLSEVVGILDLDGFMINKRFYCKELGIIKLGDASARSVFFDIGVRWAELSAKDKKTCEYVIKNIHKLPFGVPRGVNAKNLSALEGIVADDEFDPDEALAAAVKKRKFLLERMLEDRQHFPDEDDNDEDNAYVPDRLRNGLHYHYR